MVLFPCENTLSTLLPSAEGGLASFHFTKWWQVVALPLLWIQVRDLETPGRPDAFFAVQVQVINSTILGSGVQCSDSTVMPDA